MENTVQVLECMYFHPVHRSTSLGLKTGIFTMKWFYKAHWWNLHLEPLMFQEGQ